MRAARAPLLLLLAFGCKAPETFDKHQLLVDLSNDVMLVTNQSLASQTAVLAQALDALAAAPDAASLAAAQQAWADARHPLKQGESFAFGPIEDGGYGAAMDFWPARPDSVEALLAGDEPVDAAALATMGATVRGFPVVELLIFGDSDEAALAALAADDEAGARRRAYLAGLGGDLAMSSGDLAAAWTDGYAAELASAGEGSEAFPTVSLALSALLNQSLAALEGVKVTKLGAPLGKKTGGAAQPDAVESPYADASLSDITDSLSGFQALYLGGGGLGLTDDVQHQQPALDPKMRGLIDDALAAVAAIPAPLREAVGSAPDAVEAAYQATDALLISVNTELVVAFGVTVTFTDNDGD